MNTINLQTYSWITEAISTGEQLNHILKKKVKPGTTIHELFSELAAEYPEFRKTVYDPGTNSLNDQVMIIVNGKLVQTSDLRSRPLQDNDSITISPIMVGG